MNYKIVTAFDETSLQHSTFHLLNEFKDNWRMSDLLFDQFLMHLESCLMPLDHHY